MSVCMFFKAHCTKRTDMLIIRAGTNDVHEESPKEITEKIIKLAENFKKDCDNTEVIITTSIRPPVQQGKCNILSVSLFNLKL